MKNPLDIGYMKLNPLLIKYTMEHVLEQRRKHVFGTENGRKPIKVVPKTITKNTYKRRLVVRKSNAV